MRSFTLDLTALAAAALPRFTNEETVRGVWPVIYFVHIGSSSCVRTDGRGGKPLQGQVSNECGYVGAWSWPKVKQASPMPEADELINTLAISIPSTTGEGGPEEVEDFGV